MEISADEPITLMDLDVDLINEVLSHCEARWRLAALQTCRLFALITSELALETTYLVSTVAESVEVAHAELVPKLTSPPSVGVIFANSGLAQCKGAITKLLRSLPPAMHAIGGEVDTLVGTRAVGEEVDASAPADASAPSAEAAEGTEPKAAQEAGGSEGDEAAVPPGTAPGFTSPSLAELAQQEDELHAAAVGGMHPGIAYMHALRAAGRKTAPRAAG